MSGTPDTPFQVPQATEACQGLLSITFVFLQSYLENWCLISDWLADAHDLDI